MFSRTLWALCLVGLSAAAVAQDLVLRVAPGSPGRVDDRTIDAASVPANEAIELELLLNNLDFTLAGFEGVLAFPSFLTLVDESALGGSTPPFETGLTGAQQLPADDGRADTLATVNNLEGVGRFGAFIENPAQRPTSGQQLLATYRLLLGRDTNGLPTCISAVEAIRFIACETGEQACHIVADDTPQRTVVDFMDADLEVALVNTSTTIVQGDANLDGVRNVQDALAITLCVLNGFDSPDCPNMAGLGALSADDRLIMGDCNCSGAADLADALLCARRAIGVQN